MVEDCRDLAVFDLDQVYTECKCKLYHGENHIIILVSKQSKKRFMKPSKPHGRASCLSLQDSLRTHAHHERDTW
jgi:hypothetical protein